MPINSLNGLIAAIAGVAMLALAGCSTPCDAPGRLCAPNDSNTSTLPAWYTRGQPPPPPPPVEQPVEIRTARIEPPAEMRTVPIDAPGPDTRKRVTRIGLMLPLRSESLGAPSEALRAGFMAAYERDRDGFTVNLIETGDSPRDTLDAYAAALEQNDIIVGPLARSAVGALAASSLVQKPTIALNHPEARGRVALPPQMLAIGLSIEDEARQVAEWAGAENPGGVAMIISGSSAWQRRIASGFAARWKQLGHQSQMLVLADTNGYLSEAALGQLRSQVDSVQPALVFTALDPSQAGQVRSAVGPGLPFYGTSSVNPGADPNAAIADLDGVRMLDMPWEMQPAHQAVMAYPRWAGSARTLDMDRLYALGIDAFRVAREITLHPGADIQVDGVTGKLSIGFGNGPARFERVQPAAVYNGGVFTLVPAGR